MKNFEPGGDSNGGWAVGNEKLFFRDHVLAKLQRKLEEMFEGKYNFLIRKNYLF
jgi:hypothetical protein